jgi:hypothetical protein
MTIREWLALPLAFLGVIILSVAEKIAYGFTKE